MNHSAQDQRVTDNTVTNGATDFDNCPTTVPQSLKEARRLWQAPQRYVWAFSFVAWLVGVKRWHSAQETPSPTPGQEP